MRIFPGLLVGMILCIHGATAQQIQFSCSVSSARVPENSIFEVQFELRNAKGSDFRPPSFEGFHVVGGPSIGSSTTIINGAVSQSQSWSFSLLAVREGRFTIGSASVVAGRKKRMSQPVSIEVIPPADASARQGDGTLEPILLKAVTPPGPFYPGQQIPLQYRLLFRENVQTVSTMVEDDYSDFFIQQLHAIPTESAYETVDGVVFTSRVVKALALFAHQSGTFTIEPMLMNVGVNAPFPGMHGFFTMRRIRDIQVASDPLVITVKPLPADAPATFTGAVGQYTLETFPTQNRITTDEALTFRLRFTGDGDSRRWDMPKPVSDGDFDVFEPKVTDETVVSHGIKVDHIRLAEYQMIPAAAGTYRIHVPFTYFDPEAGTYVTISSDTLEVFVTKGLNPDSPQASLDTTSAEAMSLMPVRRVVLKDRFWMSLPHLLLFGFLLTGAAGTWYLTLKKKREDGLRQNERNRDLAFKEASGSLDELAQGTSGMPPGTFFEKVTEIYNLFLLQRFSIPPSELDEAGVMRHLKHAGIPEDVAGQAIGFFRQGLSVRYGGVPGGFTPEEMLRECRRIIGLLSA